MRATVWHGLVERGASVSALVRESLNGVVGGDSPGVRLTREEEVLRARIAEFRAADRLNRSDVHERGE